jgi:hypothetical protein
MAIYFNVEHANGFTREGISSAAATTIDFPWPSRQVIINNDNSATSTDTMIVSCKNFWLTLKAAESISLPLHTTSVRLTPGGPYRCWAFG